MRKDLIRQGTHIICFLFCIIHSNAQRPTVLTGSVPAKDYIDQQAIQVQYVSGGTNLVPRTHLHIDKTIQLPANYQSTGVNYTDDQVNSAIDYSLPVGAIHGEGGVNQNGQAIYNIPISLPPGTNGMTPTLGVSYNSLMTRGIAGRGWGIQGFSSITRVGYDAYHDGLGITWSNIYKGAIAFTDDDDYSLDGQHLIKTSTASASLEYRFENDVFALITKTGDMFTVETKDGLTMEYGNTADSKLVLKNGATQTWYLNKVYDKHHNYILYNYYNQACEVALKEITYTGHDGSQDGSPNISPYNSVEFYYDIRKDATTQYLGGTALPSTLILREIEVDCEGVFVKSYHFNYGLNTQSFLNEIVEFGCDNEKLNSTFIKYGDDVTSANNVTAVIPTASPNNFETNADYVVGDFNGDGKADLVAFQFVNPVFLDGSRNYTDHWFLYLNQDNGTTFSESDLTSTAPLPSNFFPYPHFDFYSDGLNRTPVGFQVADFNMDGRDDILIGQTNGTNTVYTVYYSTGNGFTTTGTNLYPQYPYTTSDADHSQFVLADVDGDGIPEGIEYTPDYAFIIHWFNTGDCAKIESDQIKDVNGTLVQGYVGFSAIDFDGDGTQELLTSRADDLTVLKLSFIKNCAHDITGTVGSKEICQKPLTSPYTESYFGDFNGDGITDYIAVNPPTNPNNSGDGVESSIRLGTGTDYTPFVGLTGTVPFWDPRTQLVMDINNDGKSDFIELEKTSSPKGINFYACFGDQPAISRTSLGSISNIDFPDGDDYTYYHDNHPTDPNLQPEFLTGDFDGDGRPDIFFKTSNSGQRAIAYINQSSTQQLATTISDGFRNKITFNYATLANGGANVYSQGSSSVSYPVMVTQTPTYVAKEMGESNGVGGINTSSYYYEGAKIHLQGKGFLGFDKVISTDNTTGIGVENDYGLDDTYYERFPVSSETYLGPNQTLIESVQDIAHAFIATTSGLLAGWANANYLQVNQFTLTDNTGKYTVEAFQYDRDGNVIDNTVTTTLRNSYTDVTEINSPYTHKGSWVSSAYSGSIAVMNVPDHIIKTTTRQPDGLYSRETDFTYDSGNGSLLTETMDPGSSNEVVTTYQYYPAGVCSTKVVSPTGWNCPHCPTQNYSYEYDNNDANNKYRFVTKEINPLNQEIQAKFDPKWGTPLSTIGIDNLTTNYSYDGFGRNIKTITPDNLISKVNYSWLSSGNLPEDRLNNSPNALYYKTIITDGSPTVETYYDHLSRGLEMQGDGFADEIYSQKQYDTKGNLIEETGGYKSGQSDFIRTTYSYADDQNRPNMLMSEITSDGGSNANTTNFSYSYPGYGETMVTTIPPDYVITRDTRTYKTTDATSKLTSAQDAGGTLYYSYFSNGNIKDIRLNSTLSDPMESMTYDGYGNQASINDKSSNTSSSYQFNSLGQLTKQTDGNGNVSENFLYDPLGRITSKEVHAPIKANYDNLYSYIYVHTAANGVNQIKEKLVAGTDNSSYNYTYDALSRLSFYSESYDSKTFITSYQYDAFNNVSQVTYPGGFTVFNVYDNQGHSYLTKIKSANDVIWQADEVNSMGQFTKFTSHLIGNPVQSQIDYTTFGFLREYRVPSSGASNIHHYQFGFDATNGNLLSRADLNLNNISETFYNYDNLNRLSNTNGPSLGSVSYNLDGTIQNKTYAGSYDYSVPFNTPNMLALASNANTNNTSEQDISYTAFNKVQSITEGDNVLNITYNCDEERNMTVLKSSGKKKAEKHFYPGYEELITYDASESVLHSYEINYVNAPTGLCAMYVTTDGVGKMYYVYTDHLGSILTLTDNKGVVQYRQSFDAWGNYRDPDTWEILSDKPSNLPDWLYRGFTGHEHLPEFGLINMNGRCYDPVVGMMISPDNDVQMPDNTQNYNRYSYVLNNPLKNTDPSGENFLDDVWRVLSATPKHDGAPVPTHHVTANYWSSMVQNYNIDADMETEAQAMGSMFASPYIAPDNGDENFTDAAGSTYSLGFYTTDYTTTYYNVRRLEAHTISGYQIHGDWQQVNSGTGNSPEPSTLTKGPLLRTDFDNFVVKYFGERIGKMEYKPDIVLTDNLTRHDGRPVGGLTTPVNQSQPTWAGPSLVQINSTNLTNKQLVYINLAHELTHAEFVSSGQYGEWVIFFGRERAQALSEFYAYDLSLNLARIFKFDQQAIDILYNELNKNYKIFKGN